MISIGAPQTEEEFAAYYALRYEVLRKPWGAPDGTEKDKFEDDAIHAAAYVYSQLAGVGRLHQINEREGKIRYMAVRDGYTGRGVGREILHYLEDLGYAYGVRVITLNARENAVSFYERHGYEILGEGPLLWGEIRHLRMRKTWETEAANG